MAAPGTCGPVRAGRAAWLGAGLTGVELTRLGPFTGLPDGVVAVLERRAGYLSPARLRSLLLGLAQRYGVQVEPAGVDRISADPLSVRLRDGQDHRADRVVVAAGAWSPGLLAGLERAGPGRHTLITKLIQYTRFETDAPPGLPAFVDETTGLYGRPDQNGLLLGLPTTGWRVDPQQLEADAGLVTRVADVAQLRLGLRCPLRDQPNTTVVGVDCYTEPTGLALRPVVPDCGIYSFTGGSGGSAKIVLAASRRAAAALTDTREEET